MTALVSIPLDLPPGLARAVRAVEALAGTEFAPVIEFHPAAAEWLARRQKTLAPGERAQCEEWFAAVLDGVNGYTDEQAQRRENAIWSMCHTLPAFVWCPTTVQAIWRVTKFLPSPAECETVLAAHAGPLLREVGILAKIAAAPRRQEFWVASETPYEPTGVPEWATSTVLRHRGPESDHDDRPGGPRPVPWIAVGGENAP